MTLALQGLVIIVGAYGSGKTEIAIQLALSLHSAKTPTRLADLDLVNPYFRSREAQKILEDQGIGVILPPRQWLHADLPVLTREVAGMIRRPGALDILDVGGDGAGARVLAALGDALGALSPRVIQVVNPLRPETADVAGCEALRKRIEKAGRLRITDVVGNGHLMDETTTDIILDSARVARRYAEEAGLTYLATVAQQHFVDELRQRGLSDPLLVLKRRLKTPWG